MSRSLIELRMRRLQIALRTSFKHAAAERRVADSIWVKARRGAECGIGEGCPRAYVTGETSAGALNWLSTKVAQLPARVSDLDSLRAWVQAEQKEIDEHPAAWCAVETSLLDLFAHEQGLSIEALLNLPSVAGRYRYTAVLGDEPIGKFQKVLTYYLEMGFRDFKFKISGNFDQDAEKYEIYQQLLAARDLGSHARLRLDANNVWAGDIAAAENYIRRVPVPLFAIEEPLAARDAANLAQLSEKLDLPIILDESLCRSADIDLFTVEPRGRWIANLRISKMGGLIRSLQIIEKLKAASFGIIVGAQVGETSVLSRLALTAAQAAGSSLLAQEGAFGTLLLENDPVKPVLMFGAGGWLSYPPPKTNALSPNSGLGLELVDSF